MSARRKLLVIAPEAEADILDVLLYTEREWGQQQQIAYMSQFHDVFANLVRFPALERLQPDLGQGVRSRQVGQHVVIYRPSASELRILRVLHVRREYERELGS